MQRIKTLSEYFKKYELSEKDPESFWSEIADSFTWKKKWDKVLDWDFEKANTNFNYLVTLENIDSISKVKKNDFKKTQNRIR